MKTNSNRNAETLRQIFSADKFNSSVLDHVLDTDKLLEIAKDGNDSLNKNNEIRAHTNVPSYPDPNGKTVNSYVCEITIAPILNEDGLSMSWFENSLEDINKDLLSLGLQEVKDLGKIYTVRKHGIDINIFVKYIDGEYDKRYESYSIPNIKSKFEEKLEEAIKKSKAKTNSYRRINMKKNIKSGKFIKSGTSNFADNRASVDFPLVAYFAENYVFDEETGSETEERDYDADSWEYEDAYDSAKELAEEMGIEISDFDIHRMRYDSRDAGYEQPFFVGIGSGYYDGLQIFIDDNLYFSPEDIANDEGLLDEFEYAEDQADYDRVVKEVEERVQNEWADKINAYLDKLCSDYNWMKLGVSARFSNGETWYDKIDNSRKPIKSRMSYQDALAGFTSMGKPWGDYWEMQQDWTAYVDSLERDGEVDYEESKNWDNPCTPQTFKEWINE